MAGIQGKPKNKGLRRLPGLLGGLLLAVLVIAGIYLAAVLLESPEEMENSGAVREEAPPAVTRMQSAAMDDAAALARMFEAPLPVLPGASCRGEAGNAVWDGQTARIAHLYYDGFTVSAVQPAAAAPLLLYGDLAVSLQSGLTVLGLPAMLAERGNARCLYFSSEKAAYALFAPETAAAGTLHSLAERLAWTE